MRLKKEQERGGFLSKIKRYIDLKINYYQLLFIEKVSLFVSNLFFKFIFAALALILFCFVLLLVYQLLIVIIAIPWVVTLVEIAIVLLVMLILWAFKDKLIITPIADSIVRFLVELSEENAKKRENEGEDE